MEAVGGGGGGGGVIMMFLRIFLVLGDRDSRLTPKAWPSKASSSLSLLHHTDDTD